MNVLANQFNVDRSFAKTGLIKKLALGSVLAGLPLLATPQDIEIYSATVGTGGPGSINPNLLFIADTSGSMGQYVATEVTKDTGNYDPTVDYGGDGDAADDDYIYVYNSVESYTGVYITPAQNSCQTIDNTLASNPNYPVYFGQAMQWIPELVEVEVAEAVVCEEDSLETEETYSGVVGTYYDGWQVIDIFDHTQITGGSMELDVTPVNGYSTGGRRGGNEFGVEGRLQVIQTDAGGNETGFWSTTSCTVDTDDENSEDCTLDFSSISYTYFKLRISLRSESIDYERRGDVYPAEDISHETVFTYNIGEVAYSDGSGGECTPSDPVYDTVEDGDWKGALQIGATDEFILECEADQGVHGQTDASTLKYASLCGTAQCAEPYYTNANGIDWTTTGVDHRYFMDGNYHDYLNAPLTVDGERVWEVAMTYYDCGGSGCSVEGSSPYSLETWCDENENDIYYLEEDGSYTAVGNYRDAYFTDSVNDPGTVYTCETKQKIMITALSDMASSMTGVNMGLMQFNTAGSSGLNGGTVTFAVRDVDAYMGGGTEATSSEDSSHPTVRSSLLAEIGALPASGNTPLSESLYEAYRYFSGLTELNNDGVADDYYDDTVTETPDSVNWDGNYNFVDRSGDTYDSPIDHSCQVNSVVYITDGEPTSDTGLDSTIASLIGRSCDGNCLDELAGYMYDNDLVADDTVDGVNNVITYTVGFAIDFELLEQTANAGGGNYYTATNYSDLMAAFQEILVDIALSEPSVLVAPAVSVNAFNELQHRNQIYYATFKPRSTPKWEGNVKKYTITGEGIILDNSAPPQPAIDDSTGFFSTYAQSFWSNTPDGAYVELGGYREQLTNSRNIYVDGESLTLGIPGSINQLTSSSILDLVSTGATSLAEAAELRDWILGVDIDDENDDGDTTDAHQYAGESLHSKPFVVTYRGTSEADAVDILIVTTNQGMVHAIDARDAYGTELWAYIPDDTIDNIKQYRDNPPNTPHVYGLDGEATVWTIESASSSASNFDIEYAYMFQGMRRGGDKYYGWDISNGDLQNVSSAPISRMWTIDGGTSGFMDLGQSWSKMIRTKIRYGCDSEVGFGGCTTKDVLVFSGGYDTYYDNPEYLPNDGAETTPVDGNAVYIVDALTGDLLWSTSNDASSSDSHLLDLPIYNSVPGDPSPIDIDGDGDMDMLFFVDVSGKVFRVDFDQTRDLGGTSATTRYASGGLIADLEEDGVFRRFYNGLDVSLVAPVSRDSHLAISVGSGYRAHPKEEETWANRFYVVIDENVNGPEIDDKGTAETTDDEPVYSYVKTYDVDGNITSRSIITAADLHAYSIADPYDKGTDGDYGFYRTMDASIYEKILQTSVTFNGDIIVSSYTPISDTTEATCGSGEIGAGRVYRFSLVTGETQFYDRSEYIELAHEGIPPDPTILLVPELVVCIGTECFDSEDGDDKPALTDDPTGTANRIYWREI